MGKYFPDDDNYLLRRIQLGEFSNLGGVIFRKCADRYMEAIRLIEVETEISKKIYEVTRKTGYRIEILRPIYDLISAYFRFTHNPHGQLALPLENQYSVEEDYTKTWIDFYFKEVEKLAQVNSYAQLLIRSVIYQNEKEGFSAVDELENRLRTEQYPTRIKKKILPELIIEENIEIVKKAGRF